MIAFHLHQPEAMIIVALVAAIPATIGAIAAIKAAKGIRTNTKAIDTGNERDIGTTVHDLAQITEVILAQNHINTRELLGLREDHHDLTDKFQKHLDNVAEVMEEHKGVWSEMEKIYAQRAEHPEKPKKL